MEDNLTLQLIEEALEKQSKSIKIKMITLWILIVILFGINFVLSYKIFFQ